MDSVNCLAEKRQTDLESEQKCSVEVNEALEMAMEGHSCILNEYAELKEKHIALLAKHRKIREGVSEAKRSALSGGVKGAELELIEARAAELAALKLDRERTQKSVRKIRWLAERTTRYCCSCSGNRGACCQPKRGEVVPIAQDTATRSEQETEELCREIGRFKQRHVSEIAAMNQRIVESRLQKASVCPMCKVAERANYEFPPTDEASLQEDISARDVEQ